MTAPAHDDLELRLANALWREVLERQLAGEIPEAMKLYRTSLALRETAEAHTFLGWTLSFQGELDAAITQCRKAIEADPDFGNPYNDIGAYLVELDREDEAIAWFAQAKQANRYENPQFPYLNLARIYTSHGDYGLALMELHTAAVLAPEDERVRQLTRRIGTLLQQESVARAA
ncbi:MAG: hypothetical protein VX498_11165 [Myxococcota bacterium]|nr:hypothetical protein [Myxococcota bacterium]